MATSVNRQIGHRSTNRSLFGMLSLKLGRRLQWDSDKAVVVDDPEATSMRRRDYRQPRQYPEV